MAKLKLRVELNKGRIGIPLGKLANLVEETLLFLKFVHGDAALPGSAEGWLAFNFKNESVDFDCECASDIAIPDVQRANSLLRAVMTNDATSNLFRGTIRARTRRQYSKIAAPIDPDEKVVFGLFSNGENEPKEKYSLTKSFAYDIDAELPSRIKYYGEIQGSIHAFYKGDKPRRLVIREISTKNLMDCFFDDELYASVVKMLEDKQGVVFVEGDVEENLINGTVEAITAKGFKMAPLFDEARFNELIGSAPGLTGNLSTEEFVGQYRSNGFPS